MYFNKAIIGGNLTRDPEKKALPNGTAVTNFSVATNRFWKDQNGKMQESTDYHNIVVFGRQAETCAQYLTKGQTVLIEGRIQTRSWDDKDGSKKYRTEIIADKVQFGSRGNGGGESAPKQDSAPQDDMPSDDSIEYPEEEINPEDIPF